MLRERMLPRTRHEAVDISHLNASPPQNLPDPLAHGRSDHYHQRIPRSDIHQTLMENQRSWEVGCLREKRYECAIARHWDEWVEASGWWWSARARTSVDCCGLKTCEAGRGEQGSTQPDETGLLM